MKDELLFTMLVFGFLRFSGSFPGTGASNELLAPNAGAFPEVPFDCG